MNAPSPAGRAAVPGNAVPGNAVPGVGVLIVGGGVAGLTASLLLSDLGVDHYLIERHEQTALLPKAHIINQRTMEIFRQLGLAEEIYAAGAPPQNMSSVAWTTSLAGPTPLHGRRIARVDAWCGDQAYAAASSCRATNLPQLRLEPILRRRAEQHDTATVLFAHELLSFHDVDRGIRATILDRRAGIEFEVEAGYLIAADGGRTVGPSVGIELRGERDLLDMVSTHFSADLSSFWPDDSVVISFSTNPDGEGSLGSGVLLPMGPDVWGAKSAQWQYHSALHTGDPDQFDSALMLRRMRDMLGLPDLQPQIHSVSRWRFEGVVADRYRSGRIFLVGDSAHRHPPNGGLGLNTAVGDVHNLAWKLALVLAGDAGEALLDTYQSERRPVGVAVVARALQNWRAHIAIDEALGLGEATSPQQGWRALAQLFTGTPEGLARQAAVADAVAAAAGEFVSQDLELGYRYGSPAVIEPVPAQPDPRPGSGSGSGFRPGTIPGTTVAHAWLDAAAAPQNRISTLDLPPDGGFALLVGPKAAQTWSAAAAAAAQQLGLSPEQVTVHSIGGQSSAVSGARWIDSSGAWSRSCAISGTGAVLVRPDRHVAWRCPAAAANPASDLIDVLSDILARPGKGSPCSS